MFFKQLTEAYGNLYKKLNPNERRLFFILTALLLGSFYLTAFLKPTLSEVSKLKKQQQENQARLQMLISQYPDANKSKQELERIKRNIENMRLEVANIESRLVGAQQVPQLLTELVKRAQELSIDLESLKQDIKEEGEGFARLYIALEFSSNFENTLNYIKNIEYISPFTKIEEMEITQSKAEPNRLVSVFIKLNTVLSYEPDNQGKIFSPAQGIAKIEQKAKRSPFTPVFAAGEREKKKLKVTGITYRRDEGASSAIINGSMVKIGEQIEGVKIERILPDSVTVNNGAGSYKLQVER